MATEQRCCQRSVGRKIVHRRPDGFVVTSSDTFLNVRKGGNALPERVVGRSLRFGSASMSPVHKFLALRVVLTPWLSGAGEEMTINRFIRVFGGGGTGYITSGRPGRTDDTIEIRVVY